MHACEMEALHVLWIFLSTGAQDKARGIAGICWRRSEYQASTEESRTVTRSLFWQSIYDQAGVVTKIQTWLLHKVWKVAGNAEKVGPTHRSVLSSPGHPSGGRRAGLGRSKHSKSRLSDVSLTLYFCRFVLETGTWYHKNKKKNQSSLEHTDHFGINGMSPRYVSSYLFYF